MKTTRSRLGVAKKPRATRKNKKGHTRETRRCPTSPAVTPRSAVTFYPNIPFDRNGQLWISAALPDSPLRDDSLDSWLDPARSSKLSTVANSTGLLYLASGTPDRAWKILGSGERACTSATFFLLEVGGVVVGVSAFHPLTSLDAEFEDVYAYVCPSQMGFDTFTSFSSARVSGARGFVRVELRKDLVVLRHQYLDKLATTRAQQLIDECRDPVLELQLYSVPDVLFFTPPPELMSFPRLKLASAPPAPGSTTAAVAFHDVGGLSPDDDDDEGELYEATPGKIPAASALLNTDRSVSLGKVLAVGTGIVDVVSTMEANSSGSALLDDSLEVFAVSSGAFYDSADTSYCGWSEVDKHSLIAYHVSIPEGKAVSESRSKNFNVATSVFHSYFQEAIRILTTVP